MSDLPCENISWISQFCFTSVDRKYRILKFLKNFIFVSFLLIWLYHVASGILVLQPGIKRMAPAAEALSLRQALDCQGSPLNLNVEIIVDSTEKLHKWYRKLRYTFPPDFPNANSLHNQGTMIKTRKINIGTMLNVKLQAFLWIPPVFPVMSFTFPRFSSVSDTAFSICSLVSSNLWLSFLIFHHLRACSEWSVYFVEWLNLGFSDGFS